MKKIDYKKINETFVRKGFKTPSHGKSPLRGGGGVPPLFRWVFGNRPSVKGRGYPPLSVNFFPLTFWAKKQCFFG